MVQGAHPALAESMDLRAFLEDNDGAWQIVVCCLHFRQKISDPAVGFNVPPAPALCTCVATPAG